MSVNIARALGITVGIIVGLIVAVVLIRYANVNRKIKTEYDERQTRIRGEAYKYAFYSVVIYETIMLVLEMGEIALPVEGYVLRFAGIVIGCLVLSGYCIWNDVYWGQNNNRRRYGVIFVAAGLLNALPVALSFLDGTPGKSGGSAFPLINLLACVLLLAIGAELFIKYIADKYAERTED